jgi:hypothetical protein
MAISALVGSSGLWAEANPYYIGVSQAFAHDSNLYRTEKAPQPDKYSITGLFAGIDQPFGRQRFYANGSVRATRFEDITELNNTSYGVNVGLDWSTIEQISGSFNVSQDQSLANYGASSLDQPQITKKNLETTQQIIARAQLGLVSLLSLDAGVTHRQVDYSAAEFAQSQYKQNAVSLGLTYRPSGLLTLGSAVRLTRGEYPGIVLATGGTADFSRKDLDLTATWFATGLSTLNARLSFGRQTSDTLTQRNFSGTTGSISWAFLPTGKLSFNTTLSRDTGAESSFFNITGTQLSGNGDNSRLTTAFALESAYAATAKIKVNAALRYSRRSLVDQLAVAGAAAQSAEGTDTLTVFSLGANYEPTRSLLFGCNAGRESRSASGGLSNSYTATTANCSAQFTLK